MLHPHSLSRRTLIRAAGAVPLLALPGMLRAAEIDVSDLAGHHHRRACRSAPATRTARIARAQALMQANGIGAVLVEPGSSLIYFTGVRWGRSERLTAAVLPVEGEPCIVTPFFEEPSVRETLGIPAEVRVWQEDEDPLAAGRRLAEGPQAGRAAGRDRGDHALLHRRRAAARAARRHGSSRPIRSCAAAG